MVSTNILSIEVFDKNNVDIDNYFINVDYTKDYYCLGNIETFNFNTNDRMICIATHRVGDVGNTIYGNINIYKDSVLYTTLDINRNIDNISFTTGEKNNYNHFDIEIYIGKLPDEYKHLEPKYPYLNYRCLYTKIPEVYLKPYAKIIYLTSLYGEEMVKDCSSKCNSKNKSIIDCFNVFNAACSAYIMQNIKSADFLINYVNKQLDLLYPSINYPQTIQIKDSYDQLISVEI